jgi:hypothetical protein
MRFAYCTLRLAAGSEYSYSCNSVYTFNDSTQPYSSFYRDNRDNPWFDDFASFEKALAEYIRSGRSSGYGERGEP